ncbi:EamA family transporter [Sneathiella sp. DP05]|uniref:EamA family transporter n=1 Tax=Sneathiella litorea TaxID=2606216 RepID=A0A6L8W4X7_9PROT|nr:EamA family transporter [Sneathiella litorea]
MPISDNMRGAAFMSITMAAYVANDTVMKLLSDHLNLYQAMFLRGIFTTMLIGGLCLFKGVLIYRIPKGDRLTISLRLVGEVGGTVFYLTALFHMPIANASAILQALPLAVTLAGAIFLSETVGWRRYLAIISGFLGVLMIVRPGSDGFNEYSMFAVVAVLFIVLRDISTRRLSVGVPSLFISLLTSVAVMSVGALLSLTEEWRPVSFGELSLLAVAALFIIFGYLFSVMAMRIGDISFSSPFRYTILIWAIIIGIVVFGDIPDNWTIMGSLIIVGSGVYTFYRERYVYAKDYGFDDNGTSKRIK